MSMNVANLLDDIITPRFWVAMWLTIAAIVLTIMAAGYVIGSLLFG